MNASPPSPVSVESLMLSGSCGSTRFTFAEFALGTTNSIQHTLLPSPYDADTLVAHANFYGSFWSGSPARRGVLFLQASADRRSFSEVYPNMVPPTFRGVNYTDRDSAETAIIMESLGRQPLQFIDGEIIGAPHQYAEVLKTICDERRALFFPAGNRDLRVRNEGKFDIDVVIPLSVYGDRLSRHCGGPLTFNSTYFVWTEEDFASDPSARVPDPIGLTLSGGRIEHPPLYRRPTFKVSGVPQSASIISPTMAECHILLCGQKYDGLRGITRATVRHGSKPSVPSGMSRLVISGRSVLGEVVDTSLAHPPAGGFFLDVDKRVARSSLGRPTDVEYEVESLADAQAACQGSIRLIAEGRLLDLEREARAVDLPVKGGVVGEVPPNHLTPQALLGAGMARTALGISPSGSLIAVTAESVEKRSSDIRSDSQGAPMATVARLLHERGCVDALAFDGGGSTGMAHGGRLLTRPADRFDVRYVPRERVIPAVWSVSQL